MLHLEGLPLIIIKDSKSLWMKILAIDQVQGQPSLTQRAVLNLVAWMLVIWQVGALLFANIIGRFFFITDYGSIIHSIEIVWILMIVLIYLITMKKWIMKWGKKEKDKWWNHRSTYKSLLFLKEDKLILLQIVHSVHISVLYWKAEFKKWFKEFPTMKV